MANRERGEIGMEVEGQAYTLRPTLHALCELETLLDKPFAAVFEQAAQGRLSAIRALIWAYLQEYHAADIRTLKDAAQWIERAGGLDVVQAKLDELIALNSDEGGEARPPTAQPSGTGENSSSMPIAMASKTSGRSRRVS